MYKSLPVILISFFITGCFGLGKMTDEYINISPENSYLSFSENDSLDQDELYFFARASARGYSEGVYYLYNNILFQFNLGISKKNYTWRNKLLSKRNMEEQLRNLGAIGKNPILKIFNIEKINLELGDLLFAKFKITESSIHRTSSLYSHLYKQLDSNNIDKCYGFYGSGKTSFTNSRSRVPRIMSGYYCKKDLVRQDFIDFINNISLLKNSYDGGGIRSLDMEY